ncbi:DUF7710 domain-containing protein [Acinetobacter tianfuensis]|uniref:DUF7710 domain-containing protein n=1 Tax=Acinetobacter tianfuensis TaxID=2419603 RepID=A0A3A8E4G2_9GAMM|nr:hypothetical protein [Acinetobacter tianfuensis]RKG29952.1 hypothetical protein D7V32_12930 [Acinetobacter tianfuensis]
MAKSKNAYLFSAHKSNFPSAVFSSYAQARAWIEGNHLSGILMEYPQDQSCYDWAIAQGHFKDKSAIDRAPVFIAKFVSAYQQNWHFEHGELLEHIDV